jgi:hypothetical protein
MKNFFWILLAVVVMGVLLYLTKPKDIIPHSLIVKDSTTLPIDVAVGEDYEGEETFISSKTYDTKRIKSEAFIGKTFPQCLEMVSHWEDGHIIDMGDGQGGLTFMEFVTNGNHHVLTFSQDICETDEIIKE